MSNSKENTLVKLGKQSSLQKENNAHLRAFSAACPFVPYLASAKRLAAAPVMASRNSYNTFTCCLKRERPQLKAFILLVVYILLLLQFFPSYFFFNGLRVI